MGKIRFLEEREIYGDDRLNIFENDGKFGLATDLTVMLDGDVRTYADSVEDDYLKKRECSYWTKSQSKQLPGRNVAISRYGTIHCTGSGKEASIGARPVLEYDSDIPTNEDSIEEREDGVLIVEYGYYPQQAPTKEVQDELEEQYKNGGIIKTGNTYTLNIQNGAIRHALVSERAVMIYNIKPFIPVTYEEYEYKGHCYIRMQELSRSKLSNGEEYRGGDSAWIEVSPVRWLVDEEKKIMVSEKVLFAGIAFDENNPRYEEQNFYDTDIAKFMQEYFIGDLTHSRDHERNGKTHYSDEEIVKILEEKLGHKIADHRLETQNNMLVEEPKFEQIYSKSNGIINKVFSKIKSFFLKDRKKDENIK